MQHYSTDPAHAGLPFHPTMRHPHTGLALQAVGFRRSGAPIWPIAGASPDDKPADKTGEDKTGDDDKPKAGDDTDKDDNPDGDKPLGPGGEKALKSEREARKALETELGDLKKGLAAALGLGADDKDNDGDELAKIQLQIASMQHENTVLAVANEHRITDKADLEILTSIKDVEAMKKLAERLAPAEEERDAKSRRPKPDRGQGGGGSDSGPAGGKSVAQVMADRRAAREAKKN